MFKSFQQLFFKQFTKSHSPKDMKNIKIADAVHRELKIRSATEGIPITDLASLMLYSALTEPTTKLATSMLEDIREHQRLTEKRKKTGT